MRWCAILTLGLAVVAPAPVRAQSGDGASIVTHGLRISLGVPRRSYPRNAVIAVTLSIRNISRRGVSIMSGLNAPGVTVSDASGREVYDPINPLGDLTLVTRRGPGPLSVRLPAHRTWILRPYVVLRGSALVARITLGSAHHLAQEVSISAPRVPIRLTSEPAPRVVMSTSPLEATLIPPSPESSRFVSFSQTRCDNRSGSSGWMVGTRSVITPGGEVACKAYTWHAIAGWLNHAVATITYETGASQ